MGYFAKPAAISGVIDMDRPDFIDAIEDADRRAVEAELRHEIKAGHPLFGLPITAIGHLPGQDDVVLQINDGSGRVAQVHVTWAGKRERPPWPSTAIFSSLAELVKSVNAEYGEQDGSTQDCALPLRKMNMAPPNPYESPADQPEPLPPSHRPSQWKEGFRAILTTVGGLLLLSLAAYEWLVEGILWAWLIGGGIGLTLVGGMLLLWWFDDMR